MANKFCSSLVALASASSTLSVAHTNAVPFHCSLSVPAQVGAFAEKVVPTRLKPFPAVYVVFVSVSISVSQAQEVVPRSYLYISLSAQAARAMTGEVDVPVFVTGPVVVTLKTPVLLNVVPTRLKPVPAEYVVSVSVSVSTSVSHAQAVEPVSYLRISLSAQPISPNVYGSPLVPAPLLVRPWSVVAFKTSLPTIPSASLNVEAIVIESVELSPVIEISAPAKNWIVSV